MFKGKSILVTGGAGFVGTNLLKRLILEGARLKSTVHKHNPQIVDKRIEYIKCDLCNKEDCKRIVKNMDYVFMCAANTSGAYVIASNPLVHVTDNIIMNSLMLEAAYRAGVKKFIWLSSNAAYPPSGGRAVREEEFFNGDPYEAYFGVGWMKRYTEVLCRLYSQKLKSPMPSIVLRPSNIYGPFDDFDFKTSHAMAALIRKVVERHSPLEIWGSGNDVRDFVYIDDFIDALILSAKKLEGYQPLNIALGKGYSLKEVLSIILEIDGYTQARIMYNPKKPSMIPIRLMDISRARGLLGFRARTDIREGIKKTIQWYRNTHKSSWRLK